MAGESPVWLDWGSDLAEALTLEPSQGDVFEFWDSLTRALDRCDQFSCASADQIRNLLILLGTRGRFREREETRSAVHELPRPGDELVGAEGWRPFADWLRSASRPQPMIYQVPGTKERQLRTWLEDTVRQLDQIHSSRMWRFWMLSIRAREALGRPWQVLRTKLASIGISWPRWPTRGLHGKSGGEGDGGVAAPSELFSRIRQGAKTSVQGLRRGLFRLGIGFYRGFARLSTNLVLLARVGKKRVAGALRRPTPVPEPKNARLEPGERPRVLLVSPYPVYPADHGGGVRLFNLIQRLGKTCELYLLVFIRGEDDPEQREVLEAYCEKAYFHHWQPRFDLPLWDLRPPNAVLFSSHRARLRIRDLALRHRIQVLQLEYTELAQYHDAVDDGVKVILVEHDVAFHSFGRRRKMGFHQRFPDSRVFGATALDGARLMSYEVEACRAVDQIHVMSSHDGEFLSRYLPDGSRRIRIVPNAVDCEAYRPSGDEERQGVLFVGNFENLPNLDAFEFFTEEIWPLVRARVPEAELSVVGAKMPAEMFELDGKDGIRIVGTVPDMQPYYHGHRVLACPIRAGSGTRLKLFESFASGIPAVATRLAAEGIDYQDGHHLLIAEEPEAFAAAIERLLVDDELHRDIAKAGMSLARERYDWDGSAARNLAGILALTREAVHPEGERSAGDAREARPARKSRERKRGEVKRAIEVSVVIPTLNGGELLARSLEAVVEQSFEAPREILCVDSGSAPEDLEIMERFGARVHPIRKQDFNHGLTRDLGASLARGKILVFINQDAVPGKKTWLRDLVVPFADPRVAAVQGGIAEFPHEQPGIRRFFWDSCGERFYFTRESNRWIRRFEGLGFSTVNAAIRREVWQEIPFGWAPIMEDKKWQREVIEAGYRIESRHDAFVYHTHDYDLRSLRRRCQSEGYGWQLLGEQYNLADMLRDMAQPRMLGELWRGVRQRRIHSTAELVFPWFRPCMLFVGNRWGRQVKH